jgi:tetratricopeptide (TPR) repeat protein
MELAQVADRKKIQTANDRPPDNGNQTHPTREDEHQQCSFVFRHLRIIMTRALTTLLLSALSISVSAQSENPDTLYRNRANLVSAGRAADIWEARATTSYEAAWKLSRAAYWLGTHLPKDQRRAALERGIKAAETAIRLAPNRPEGHFWLAATMGELAQAGGMSAGLKYRGRIKDELERTIAIMPKYDEGSAEAALGQWYAKVPGLFGGDDKQAEAHLRRALEINSESRTALVDLAALLMDKGKKDEARALLRRAIALPVDPEWIPEDNETNAEARALLTKLEKK